MTNDGLNAMTYNGKSRVASSAQAGTTTTYTGVYPKHSRRNGNGLRVAKQVGAATPTVYVFSGTKVIAEYTNGAAPGSPTKEYVYSGSQLLAAIESGITKYQISDHLSLRITTDSSGLKIADSGHYPFGENWYETGGVNKLKFTSYERDAESTNDYAMLRTSVNRLGRFSSPDPIAGSIADPQSLNRYAYVLNDPANLADPTGAGPYCLLDENGNCHGGGGGGGGGTCYIDGFLSSCSMANALLQMGAAVAVPPGLALSGFINGHFYFLTAHDDQYGGYLSYAYPGLAPVDIERLGLPNPHVHLSDLLGFGGGAQGTGGAGSHSVKALARYKILFNSKCRAFIEGLLNFLHGGPQTAATMANRLSQASFSSSSTPDSEGALARTHGGTYSATVYPAGAAQTNSGLAVTLIHELFHMGPGWKSDIQMWQAAIGNRNISLPATAVNYASQQWGQKLRDNCQ